MKTIKVGVIGAGRIGKLHIENLSVRIPSSEVVAVADVFIDEANKLADRFGIKTATASDT